jgi:acetyl esterase/lipase
VHLNQQQLRADLKLQYDFIVCGVGASGSVVGRGLPSPLPAVLYFHGGGWVMGDRDTQDRLVREIAAGAQATVVCVHYAHAPEARYPVAVEQAYAATQWVATNGASIRVDATRLAVAGDGTYGALAAGVTLLAKEMRRPAPRRPGAALPRHRRRLRHRVLRPVRGRSLADAEGHAVVFGPLCPGPSRAA